ncbi:hypothetical protein [Streptomyces sp. C10]|uniref:hypothetical protein n=1 Tax=Streptomyces sp. C10 TaxID=531941 RepID=UPI00397EBC15
MTEAPRGNAGDFPTGAAAALTLLAAPVSQAAPAAPSAAPKCITAKDTKKFGRGEISLCPQSNGTVRAVGYIEDLLPGSGWANPDGYCASWFFDMGPGKGETGPMVCPHFDKDNKTKRTFDFTFKPKARVTGAHIFAASA